MISSKKKLTALDLIKKIDSQIEKARPSKREMLEDIKMMKFKIRPVTGDIFTLKDKDIGFLQSLWKLARIEELVGGQVERLSGGEKEIFFSYLEDLQLKTEEKIALAIRRLPVKEKKNIKVLELEVFRERTRGKRN